MKTLAVLLYTLLAMKCAIAKDLTYTGSTPTGKTVKDFLGIPLEDSVDFIRWKLIISDQHYTLQCNYGLSKANTTGFENGGTTIAKSGLLQKEHHYYRLTNGNKKLNLAVLNVDLLHILCPDNSFIVGNDGWSYTLNNINPEGSNKINFSQTARVLNDSMVFAGRTPCGVPGIVAPGTLCYKLKWKIVLYGNTAANKPATFKIYGTRWRNTKGRLNGNWQIIQTTGGRVVYKLNDDTGKGFLYLLKADENILLFTDASGKILTVDEDYSFTLNKHS